MSITVVLPDNKRLVVKSTIKDLLSEILEKVCEKKGLDSNKYSLYYNNKCLDLSLSLRFANIPLNSELNLVLDENKKHDQEITISIQYEDKMRKTGQFKSDETLWNIIEKLFRDDIPELNNEDLLFSINYLNKQFDGQSVLKKTTLKTLGVSGRVIFRLNCRSKDSGLTQKFVENIKFKKIENNQFEKDSKMNPSPENLDLEKTQDSLPKQSVEQENMADGKKPPSIIKKPDDYFANLKPSGNLISISDPKPKINEKNAEINDVQNSDNQNQKQEENIEVVWLGGKNDELLYSLDENVMFVENELPEDFFQHTVSDLKHLLSELKRQSSDSEEMLLTQQQREERQKSERNKYDRTILRIVFPYDRLVLQAVFKPNDQIKDVVQIISNYLKHSNIELFVAPPKTILPMDSCLYDLKLVPCGIIYCSSLEKNYAPLIKDEFKNNISSFSAVQYQTLNKIKNGQVLTN